MQNYHNRHKSMKTRNSLKHRREVIRKLHNQDMQRMYGTRAPKRHDFRSPAQRVFEVLRVSVRTTVWPSL